MLFPLKNPSPNFEEFQKMLKGEKGPKKVYYTEASIDREVMGYVIEKMMGKKFPYLEAEKIRQQKINEFKQGRKVTLSTDEEERIYINRSVEFYYRMGYDYFPDKRPCRYLTSMIMPKVRVAKDTAPLPRKGGYSSSAAEEGSREWAEEGTGIITSWEDLERFPWAKMKLNLDNHYDLLDKNLPEGMKVMIDGSFYEHVQDQFLGYEGLCYLLYDDPELVTEISGRWGEVIYNFYQDAISREIVGGIFHGDDFGYKTGTVVSPNILREIFFPWLKKYASLAHEHGKMFWLHCCGNVLKIMEDLIEDVGIDAFHSFQDVIIPVTQFKKRYGDRIATLGGVDMDKLVRMDEGSLRKYVTHVLDECMPGGRYALGSGNTIANFISIKNYLVMLEEGLQWGNR